MRMQGQGFSFLEIVVLNCDLDGENVFTVSLRTLGQVYFHKVFVSVIKLGENIIALFSF